MLSAFSVKRDVYIEIAKRYEKLIRLGVLNEGDKLPAVRVAAGELRVNPNTVHRGIAQLVEYWSPKPWVVGSSPSAPAIERAQAF